MKRNSYRLLLGLCIFAYIFVSGFTSFINVAISRNGPEILIHGISFPILALSGCLTSINIFIVILMLLIDNARYWKVALVLQCIQISIVGMSIIKRGNLQSIPGVFLVFLGIIIVLILQAFIRRLKNNEEALDRISYTDVLTALPNRRALMKHMEKLSEEKKQFFLIFADLDNFKIINDSLGHEKGDSLLKFVSRQWQKIGDILSDFYIYRLGGDEFAMIAITENEALVFDLCETITNSITSTSNEFSSVVTCSAGYAHFPNDTDQIKDLLIYADIAMYESKFAGKNQFKRFDKKMSKKITDQFSIEKIIRERLNDAGLHIVFQPQAAAEDGAVTGWEVLSRVKDNQGNALDTGSVIKVAEKSVLIQELDLYVLEKALSQTRDYYKKGGQKKISINISGGHVLAEGFIESVSTILEAFPEIPRSCIAFEITESTYIHNLEKARNVLVQLKKTGCKIALDDFGTGYSSLKYLSHLPIDIIKIDKSFIDEIEKEDSFVKLIISIGHLLGHQIIAEGVETKEQLDILKELGCDVIQGFYFGKPEAWKVFD